MRTIDKKDASGDLRSDVDPVDLMRVIYGLSTVGSTETGPKGTEIRRHTSTGLPSLIDAFAVFDRYGLTQART